MKREAMLDAVRAQGAEPWDVVVIGGGATGAGVAVDAATRGYRTLLVEREDFGKGTSSRSTKLVHGGVRYLEQGNVRLVMEALKERGLLRQNAPHLVHDLPFVVPNYSWWEAPFYGIGMKIYDLLAVKYSFGKSRVLSREETLEKLPTIATDGLRGGVVYHDGQFDDTRLLTHLMMTAADHGAVVLNYAPAVALSHDADGYVDGVTVEDRETGSTLRREGEVRGECDGDLYGRGAADGAAGRRDRWCRRRRASTWCLSRVFCGRRRRSWCRRRATDGSCLRFRGMGTPSLGRRIRRSSGEL